LWKYLVLQLDILDHFFLGILLPKLGTTTLNQWQREKYLQVYHHGEKRELPLHYNFVTDAQQYSEEQLQRSLPTLILHGTHDEVIPIKASQDFARSRPWVKLVELDSDHALGNVTNEIWQEIKQFCQIPENCIIANPNHNNSHSSKL
jgi:pimeloyl-ACP methyl ester carboxylesterase